MSSAQSCSGQADVLIVQNDPPHPSGRDRRGVLMIPTHDKPTVCWNELSYALASIHGGVNPNVVRYRLPARLRLQERQRAPVEIQAAFANSFPNRALPHVRVSPSRFGFKYLDIETPLDNVAAQDIIRAARNDKWRVNASVIGEPLLVGFHTASMVHAIRFDKIPHDDLQAFLHFVPELFKLMEPSIDISIVDVWRVENRVTLNSALQQTNHWVFGGSILVLFGLAAVPASVRVADLVHKWPGWYMWRAKSVISLVFPGRYEYCTFCKYTAQNENGNQHQRHLTHKCRKLVCMKCGLTGHYDSACPTSASVRRR